MAAGVNKVIVIGNLGKDPEVRYGQGGSAVCKMAVAVGERVKRGETWEDHTEWVTVTAFGKTAELCGEHLAKGRQVYVEGKMRTRKYEKDGVTKYSTEVVADTVQFLGKKGEDGASTEKKPQTPKATETAPEDDLPF